MRVTQHGGDTVKVFDPTGKASDPQTLVRGNRIGSQAEFVIGFLDNHKHNSAKILARIEERFRQNGNKVRFVHAKKPEAGKPAPEEILARLATECHAVVTGIAD